MKRELSHDDAFVLLDAAALDALDPVERDAVLAHAAGCDVCRPELAAFRETANQLAFAVPAVADAADAADPRRERIHSRLMDRVAADARARGVTPLRPPEDRPPKAPPTSKTAERKRELAISALAWRRGEWMATAARKRTWI